MAQNIQIWRIGLTDFVHKWKSWQISWRLENWYYLSRNTWIWVFGLKIFRQNRVQAIFFQDYKIDTFCPKMPKFEDLSTIFEKRKLAKNSRISNLEILYCSGIFRIVWGCFGSLWLVLAALGSRWLVWGFNKYDNHKSYN